MLLCCCCPHNHHQHTRPTHTANNDLKWNHFGGGVSAEILTTTADAFVELGLRDAGYTFINTDDCWSNLLRDNATGYYTC